MKNYDSELHKKTEQLQVDLHNNFARFADALGSRFNNATLQRGVIIALLLVVIFIK